MAENQKSNVGVILVNSLGLYKSDLFAPLHKLQLSQNQNSFLIGNKHYFYNGNDRIGEPLQPFPENYRPPEYGKPLFLIEEGQVPGKTAQKYMSVYSMSGKFGTIAKLGYLCVPDIELVCQYLTSKNPLLQRRAQLMLDRDKVVIDLLYMALETSRDLQPEYSKEVVQRVFAAIDYLKYIPLEKEISLSQTGLNRASRKKLPDIEYKNVAYTVANSVIVQARKYQTSKAMAKQY